jgi:bacterioferritin-associated ferredoxin
MARGPVRSFVFAIDFRVTHVCLCLGVTNHTVADAVAAGAITCNQVADACGAGSQCGRCRRTVRAVISSSQSEISESGRGSRR